MPYSKSNKEIQDSAFKLRSGNATPFKSMASSPLQQDRDVTKGYLGSDIRAKRVVKEKKSGTTVVRENENQYNAGYLGHKPSDFDYNDKKLWGRKFKSKTNKEGKQTKRKEKIVFDDGKQQVKRKQRVIKLGQNKGKVLSVTKSWKSGKKSVKREYIDKVDTSKL